MEASSVEELQKMVSIFTDEMLEVGLAAAEAKKISDDAVERD